MSDKPPTNQDANPVPEKTKFTWSQLGNESKGWAIDGAGRGVTISTAIFMSGTILALAKEVSDPETGYIKGTNIKASNVLVLQSSVTGLVVAFFMPMVGSFIDYSRHRRLVAAGSAFVLVAINVLHCFSNKSMFIALSFIGLLWNICWSTHIVTVYAYLPELTKNRLELDYVNFLANFILYLTQLSYTILVVVILVLSGASGDDILVGRVASACCAVCSSIIYSVVWVGHMKNRPRLHDLPPGKNVFLQGFVNLIRTLKKLMAGEFRPLIYFFFSVSFSDAAIVSFVTVALTFAKEFLEMNNVQSTILVFVTIVAAIPGSAVFGMVTQKIGPLKSLMYSLVWWASFTIVAACTMSPDRKIVAYIFSIFWGLGFGWFFPAQRSLFVTMMPAGQETEMMGLYSFSGQILQWLPPMIFAILVQKGLSMRWGLITLAFFLIVSLCILFFLLRPRYARIVEVAKATSHLRVMSEDVVKGGSSGNVKVKNSAVVPEPQAGTNVPPAGAGGTG